MKRTYSILGLAGICMVLAAACGKKFVKPQDADPGVGVIQAGGGTPPNIGGELNKLFKDLRSTPETICVTAGIEQVVAFKKGTRMRFYPNSFKNRMGQIITSGTVCLSVIEMYKPGDMISNRATTESDKGILKSGGQVRIKATQNGEEVYANVYGIAFAQPAASASPMDLYYGTEDKNDSATRWVLGIPQNSGTTAEAMIVDSSELVKWEPTPPFPPPPPAPFNGLYIFDSCTNFGWINCDHFAGKGKMVTDVNITILDTGFNDYNTQGYTIFPSLNSATTMSLYDKGRFNGWNFPIGYVAKFVFISKKHGKHYYYISDETTIVKDFNSNATMTEISFEDLKLRLSEL